SCRGRVGRHRAAVDDVVRRGHLGFAFDGPGGARCNDGVVNRLQLDVDLVLELTAAFGVPRMETLSVAEARGLMTAMAAARPPGPGVGEITDGVLRGAAGPLPY